MDALQVNLGLLDREPMLLRIRSILEQANQGNGKKVVSCFSGHLHRDYCRVIKGIPYVQINSASYFWIGPAFAHTRHGPKIEKAHPPSRTLRRIEHRLQLAVLKPIGHRSVFMGNDKGEE